ncbi:hypothetical protein BS47DRAFT_321314 [Hydnum rufescens UP504]|uniref:Uncharacterized protein n=1 Tax=Hydnum rufescens UP504 TaxID=1448309 RepID=A0A9P6DMV0_9AGAM|nr:hypothetical protein BS47DRAFT_321314 [Hydnum rufescens UP504]
MIPMLRYRSHNFIPLEIKLPRLQTGPSCGVGMDFQQVTRAIARGDLFRHSCWGTIGDISPLQPVHQGPKKLQNSKHKMLAFIVCITHLFNRVAYPRHDVQNLGEWVYKRERDSGNIFQDGDDGEGSIPSWAGGLVEIIWVHSLRRVRKSTWNDGGGCSVRRGIIWQE